MYTARTTRSKVRTSQDLAPKGQHPHKCTEADKEAASDRAHRPCPEQDQTKAHIITLYERVPNEAAAYESASQYGWCTIASTGVTPVNFLILLLRDYMSQHVQISKLQTGTRRREPAPHRNLPKRSGVGYLGGCRGSGLGYPMFKAFVGWGGCQLKLRIHSHWQPLAI